MRFKKKMFSYWNVSDGPVVNGLLVMFNVGRRPNQTSWPLELLVGEDYHRGQKDQCEFHLSLGNIRKFKLLKIQLKVV